MTNMQLEAFHVFTEEASFIIANKGKILSPDEITIQDLYRAAHACMPWLKSDADLAETLGVKPQVITTWKKGKSIPTDENMIRLARALNMPEEQALTLLGHWRTQQQEQKEANGVFRKILQKFQADDDFRQWALSKQIIATLALTFLVMAGQSKTAVSSDLQAESVRANSATVYIMENIVRLVRTAIQKIVIATRTRLPTLAIP